MISYFRQHDVFVFVLVIILMIVIKIPVFVFGSPMLLPEILWHTAGERLSDGILMYRDLYDTLEPLSAGFYYLLSVIHLDGHLSYQIIATILIISQALLFNYLLNANGLFAEKNFVPALLYGILSCLFVDFNSLSPILLGTIPLMLSLHTILKLVRFGDDDELSFYTGTFIGLSALFYFPYFVFLFFAILSLLLYTSSSIRKYFLMGTGFLMPYIVVGTYYFLNDGLSELIDSFVFSLFSDSNIMFTSLAMFLIALVPLIYLLMSFGILSFSSRYINYQYVAIRILGLWLIFGALSLYFTELLTPLQLFVFIPPLSFFIAHFFMLIKNKWILEGFFFTLLIIILWINIKTLVDFSNNKMPQGYEKLSISKDYQAPVTGEKILILGDDFKSYKGNHLATPFLNWELSEKYFTQLDDYRNISTLYAELSNNLPEVIIDQENLIPTIFERIPQLGRQYQKADTGLIYRLKK